MDDNNVSITVVDFENVDFDSKISEGDFARFVVLIIENSVKEFSIRK